MKNSRGRINALPFTSKTELQRKQQTEDTFLNKNASESQHKATLIPRLGYMRTYCSPVSTLRGSFTLPYSHLHEVLYRSIRVSKGERARKLFLKADLLKEMVVGSNIIEH